MKTSSHEKPIIIFLTIFMAMFFVCPVSFSRTITQIMPTLNITEEYSDNYLKTDTNKQEEYITSYGLGFSLGFLNKKSQIYFAYDPKYKDYKNLDNRDGFEHNLSATGHFTPSKFTTVNAGLSYTSTSQDTDYAGRTWENSADISGSSQLTKNTDFHFSQSYSRKFDQQLRTGTYREHDVNKTSVGIGTEFGKKDRAGLDFSYEFDNYANSDADEYTKYRPSGFVTYWFTPLNGFDSNLSYEQTDFDQNSVNDIDTYEGYVRYLRKFSKHFNGYIKYRHLYSERDSGDHNIFHPSVGFDWKVTKDSGISLGAGVLFSRWTNNAVYSDSTDPFLDIDAYKTFNFSRRGSLSITGSSGYTEAGEDAASLGYNIYYKAGFRLSYQLLKRLSSNIFASYKRDEFSGTAASDRKDNTMSAGAGFSWLALKWLKFNLTYSYTDFDTDTNQRGDYTENKATFSVSFIPEKPVRMKASPSRQTLENAIYNY
jgi:hypothetical protein